jgi:gamma-glutamyltranspeptidase/glutathione hydrolase
MTIIRFVATLVAIARVAASAIGQPHAGDFQLGAVAADHPLASDAGAQMLRRGGNAVDAAVATSFTLSVVRPQSCGIGGGGFMVIYLPDDPTHGRVLTAINYRETAPAGATPDMFETARLPDASTRSGLAVAVPGTVAGLLYALDHYGTLDRAAVLQPAIDAATNGFIADAAHVSAARTAADKLTKDQRNARPTLWHTLLLEGAVAEGDTIRNPQHADTLVAIAEHGRDGFYAGPVAEHILRACAEHGGIITAADLHDYQPAEIEPIAFTFDNKTVLAMPPPSSGGVTMCEAMGILERLGYTGWQTERNTGGPEASFHMLLESLKHAFADRAEWLADPAFCEVPTDTLISAPYLAVRAAIIDPDHTLPPASYGTRNGDTTHAAPRDAGTSHLSVIDQWGGAVACTETINLEFGSMIPAEDAGFCLNNEMDDFTTVRGQPNAFGLVQSDRNLPQPGKRPLSSMSPTIVLDADGQVIAVAGASGGPRIITGTMQVLLNALVEGMDAADAVAAPRVHHQWMPDVVRLEPGLQDHPEELGQIGGVTVLAAGLRQRGHTLGAIDAVGVVQLITRDESGLHAACDPRKGGRPAGH